MKAKKYLDINVLEALSHQTVFLKITRWKRPTGTAVNMVEQKEWSFHYVVVWIVFLTFII